MTKALRGIASRIPAPMKRLVAASVSGAKALQFAIARPILLARRHRRRSTLAAVAAAQKPVVLFLAPEAGLTPFFASHAILARTLGASGHQAIVLSCNGLLPICTFKFAMGMKPTAPDDNQNHACRQCRAQALSAGAAYDLVDVPLESLVGVRERKAIDDIMAENAARPWDIVFDGISFGAAVSGDTLRQCRKLAVTEFTADDLALLKALLFSSLAIYFALKILFARYAVKRIVYFGDYAYWISAQLLARRHGVAATHITHAYNLDVDRRFIEMRPGSVNAHMLHQVETWADYRDFPIRPTAIERIATSALYRLSGHGGMSTYSPNWVRRDQGLQVELGLSPKRKTLVAYPSSSDEFVAASKIMEALGKPYACQHTPFADQMTWLRALVEWVGARSDLQLVIRFHPRIGVGHRHGSHASEYFHFRQEFTAHPANVAVIWPEDAVSSYNLAEIADVALVAWSTIGLELARFGVPVVAAFPNRGPYPVGSFIRFAEDAPGYFAAIESALDDSASLASITEAFRWTHFVFYSPVVDVSDLIPAPDYAGIPRWRMPKNQKVIVRAFAEGENVSTAVMAQLPRGTGTEASEREAILQAVHRFLAFFLAGDDHAWSRLANLQLKGDGMLAAELAGAAIRRYSPLASRLVPMLDVSSEKRLRRQISA